MMTQTITIVAWKFLFELLTCSLAGSLGGMLIGAWLLFRLFHSRGMLCEPRITRPQYDQIMEKCDKITKSPQYDEIMEKGDKITKCPPTHQTPES